MYKYYLLAFSKVPTYLFLQAIARKGAPLQHCWGFIDGTARHICRPSVNQEEYYSGHKRHHCIKFQSTVTPDGLIISLLGPFSGRRHDSGKKNEENPWGLIINHRNNLLIYK